MISLVSMESSSSRYPAVEPNVSDDIGGGACAFESGFAVDDIFRVSDDESANWVIRKIADARAYAERVAAWAEKEQARAKHEEESLLFRFGEQLKAYARRKIEEQGGRRKSVNLPAGCVGFRKEGPKIVIDDEGVVVEWAKKHHPDLVSVVERLSKGAFNQLVEQTGEVPDHGVHVEAEREKFYVR